MTPAMGGAFLAAWSMVRRRSLLLPALGAVVVFSIMAITFTFTTAAAPGGSRVTDPPTTLDDLEHADALAGLIGRPIMVLGVVVLAVSILHMTGLLTSGFIRVQLVIQPRRGLWLMGNWAALTCAAVIASVLTTAVAVTTSYACAAFWDVDTTAWTSDPRATLTASANLALGMVAFALAGSAIGLWLRSAITALTACLVYALFENMINAVAPFGQGLLPASAFTTVATSGANGNLYLPSLIATALVTAAICTGALGLITSRNVTD